MTAIGKMLVFLVLLLSLVWNGLVVVNYVARTNWQREAKKYQTDAVGAAEAANKMKGLRDAEAESADDAKRALQQERNRYFTQVQQLLEVRDKLSKDYNEAFSDKQQQAAKAAQLQAIIDKLSGQVKTIDDDLKKREEQANQSEVTKNKALAALTQAELDRDRYKAAAETNRLLAQKFQEEAAELKRNGGGAGGGAIAAVRAPVAPENFRGTVSFVERDKGVVYVQFSPGLDAGLKEGTILRVERLTPTGRYLGKLTVTRSELKAGVGTFEPIDKRAAPTADSLPRAGDQVSANN